MDISLMKKLANMDQIAGIREVELKTGKSQGVRVFEFYNAAGFAFSVTPDLCMDLYDLRFKGTNLAYHSKNGIISPFAFSPVNGVFVDQWIGGAMKTCGLDNVGGQCEKGGVFPTHGRLGFTPAQHFGTAAFWDGDRYVMRASGDIHFTKAFGTHVSIRRTIETDLFATSLTIHDVITNHQPDPEPVMMLYHTNFGYPLVDEGSCVYTAPSTYETKAPDSNDYQHLVAPIDGKEEELYLHSGFGKTSCAAIVNENLGLAAYVKADTANLPNILEWKHERSHDYVLALEPCNTCCLNRADAIREGKMAYLPGYGTIENTIEIGALAGKEEIASFLEGLK